MNASNSASPARTGEQLPARLWATLLGLTPKAFHLRKIPVAGQVLMRGGLTKVFRFDDLPVEWRGALEQKRRQFQCLRFGDLLDVQTSAVEQWEPDKPLTAMPAATQQKALKVKDILGVYFAAIGEGMTARDAETKTRAMWLQVFGRSISDRQIRRLVKKIEARGGPEFARLEAYADGKSVPHHNAKLIAKLNVPDEFIRAFKSKCLEPGIAMVSAAHRFFDIEWKSGREVPGFGKSLDRGQSGSDPYTFDFPLTVEQCRKFAPSRAAMLQAGRGKFFAKTAGALPTVVTSSAGLRRCERYLFDDTRVNISCLDDVTGNAIELKSYWCMEESTRQIAGYLVRPAGACRASDVDALVARVLRTCGIAAPGAGYRTTLKFERGTVACSPARQAYLEGMFPGQLCVSRTDMIGGQNAPGDFAQANSGNFFGKGKIESFMRTLDYFCRHIAGQRGGTYRQQPAQLGYQSAENGVITKFSRNSQIEEAVITAQSARALAFLQADGTERSPEARLASQAFNLQSPLYFMSEVLEGIRHVVAYYNQRRGHRMEGFRQIALPKGNGGLEYIAESPNDKANRLEGELAQIGKSPVRINAADACALLLKAKKVVCKANGVTIQLDGRSYRFWDPNSKAVAEVQRLATLEKEYVALLDPDQCQSGIGPGEIYLLQNTPGHHPSRRTFDFTSETAQFFEALPLAENSDSTNPAAIARGIELTRQNHNRIGREIVKDIAPYLRDQDARRLKNLEVMSNVTTSIGGANRESLPSTDLGGEIGRARSSRPSRTAQAPTAEQNFAAYLCQSGSDIAANQQDPEL